MDGEQPNKKRKKSKNGNNAYSKAYSSISFEERESSGRPGTPHRYFSSSFTASSIDSALSVATVNANDIVDKTTPPPKSTNNGNDPTISGDGVVPKKMMPQNNSNTSEQTDTSLPKVSLSQVVHHHVNGLCIVTVGETIPPVSSHAKIQSIEFVVSEAPPSSAGEKRKRQSKLLRGGGGGGGGGANNDSNNNKLMKGIVTPSTIIANLKVIDNDTTTTTTIPIYACVWGEVIELNHKLTSSPDILQKDPLIDGYVAIILPTGKFPPPRPREETGRT